jgi:hypothetical protein
VRTATVGVMSMRAAGLAPLLCVALLIGACTGGAPSTAAPSVTPGRPGTVGATTPPSVTTSPSTAGTTNPNGCGDDCGQAVARFDDDVVPEASGLEHSLRHPDVIWVLDDGPEVRGVYATSVTRGPLGLVGIEGLAGGDTEALATGPCSADDPGPCLFVGDIGDNGREREAVRIVRIPEPDVSDGTPASSPTPDVARFTYPDGPRDAEALFTVDGRLFVVTKAPYDEEERRAGPTELFEAPRFEDGQFIARGTVPVPMPADPLLALAVGNVVVGADVGQAGVVLRTYDHALWFRPPGDDTDPATFPTWPFEEIATTGPLQTEAVAFAGDDCTHDTVGEGDPTVWRAPCHMVHDVAP